MFKQYLDFNTRGAATPSQAVVGVDLMCITSYHRNPSDGRVVIYVSPNINLSVHMTPAEFDEFIVNLKTANRLKKAYD